MKIAIVGGGICGASTYLNLQKHVCKNSKLKDSIEVTIYEPHALKHDSNTRKGNIPSLGGGYGLAPNGMASLRRLDPKVHQQITERGFVSPVTTLKSARGWQLGTLPFFEERGGQPEACVMVLRQVVLDVLYDRIPEAAIVHQKVVEVKDGQDVATIKLQSGETVTCDLVIGADGVWSKARRAVLGEKYEEYNAIYKGLFTVGGFVSTDCLPDPSETGHSSTVMTFGPNGFFGYTPYEKAEVEVTEEHIRGNATLPAGKGAFWWSRSEQKDPTADPDDEAVRRELRKAHQFWKDPTIHKILEVSEGPLLKIPTWVLPKLPLWAGKRIVLAGDAAHALPSSSGQGVSQAIEDGEALALLLAHNLSVYEGQATSVLLDKTFEQYTVVRKAHVERVLDAGNRAGDTSREMGYVAEIMMYTGFWLVLKIFGAFFLKPLRNYDVVVEVEKITKK